VVVQNNGASIVGQAVVQIAAAMGVKTLSLIRPDSGPEWGKLVPHLTALGGSLVVSELEAVRHEFSKTLADHPRGLLGLNSSGGAAATLVARALGKSATLVTYGCASRAPALSAPLDIFTANDLTAKGFSLDAWLAGLSKADRDAEARAAVGAVLYERFTLLLAKEPFADFSHALTRATRVMNDRRQVVLMHPLPEFGKEFAAQSNAWLEAHEKLPLAQRDALKKAWFEDRKAMLEAQKKA
jgi:NADPH:quinone reductase-like Zn-dependent oxidoreductase